MINYTVTVFTCMLFFTSLVAHSETAQKTAVSGDDVRTRVAAADPATDTAIVPDVSIYGIPFGAPEEKVIAHFGKPNGYVQLRNNKSAMLYGKQHFFLFTNRMLSGLRISPTLLDWKVAKQSVPHLLLDAQPWKLDNGICAEMELSEIKTRAGKSLQQDDHGSTYYYHVGKTRVTLDISRCYNSSTSGSPTDKDVYSEKLYGLLIERD